MSNIQLTKYSKGGGCGCKIAPSVLAEILRSTDFISGHPNLIVGNETNDDAAVIDFGSDRLLISTTDFFTPIVNDAFDFGKIAAANALSDVYAMGGQPALAIAILGWPVGKLSTAEAGRMIDGARLVCSVAGIPLAGGHSVDTLEPLFGLSVNGFVEKKHLKRNSTAREGDLLFITKPIGAGIITTAAKRELANPEEIETAVAYMTQLNRIGVELGKMDGVNALTDITGFGLLGHLIEMCGGSNTSAEIYFDKIPQMPGIEKHLILSVYPDMTTKNFASYGSKCTEMDAKKLLTLCDPQTSGGLLISLRKEALNDYLKLVSDFGLSGIADVQIGTMVAQTEKIVAVK